MESRAVKWVFTVILIVAISMLADIMAPARVEACGLCCSNDLVATEKVNDMRVNVPEDPKEPIVRPVTWGDPTTWETQTTDVGTEADPGGGCGDH